LRPFCLKELLASTRRHLFLFPKINPRRIAYFSDNRSASTLVEREGVGTSRMKVEIECQAYVA
jgi:enamine deaminase RidA (YjgF/YER057c/UK114 family)